MNEITKELNEDEKKLLAKWAPILDKCGDLTTNEQKYLLASTLEALRNKASAANGGNVVLEPGGTLNVVNVEGTKRLVVEYDDKGELATIRQRKDWVND